MDAVPALIALVLMIWLWRELPLLARSAWQLKLLFGSVCGLICVGITLSISPTALSLDVGEWLVRLWYVLASTVFCALTFVCAPGLSRRAPLLLFPLALLSVVLLFTDAIVSGAQLMQTRFALSGVMMTRVLGDNYSYWIWVIRVAALVQVLSLVVRIKTERDGRDQNSAQVLLYSLALTYVFTGLLAAEMEKAIPAFNAQPVIGLACLSFVAGVAYTQRQFKLVVFNVAAKRSDLRRLKAIYAACDSVMDNTQVVQMLSMADAGRSQTFLLRNGQGVPVGDIGRLAWCEELEHELDRIVARWPVVRPQSIS